MSESDGIPRMTWREYHAVAGETAIYPGSGTGDMLALLYVGCGLAGEAGEVANQMKKVARDDGGQISLARLGKVLDELGDVMWYIHRVCDELDIDLETVMAANVAKLQKRKELGTISGDGERETAPAVFPYGTPQAVSVATEENGETYVNIQATGGIVTVQLDTLVDGVKKVSVDGNELCGEELELVMPWLIPVVDGFYANKTISAPPVLPQPSDHAAQFDRTLTGPQSGTVYSTSEGKLHKYDAEPVTPEDWDVLEEVAKVNPPEQIQFTAVFTPGKGPQRNTRISRIWYDTSEADARRNIMERFGPLTKIESITVTA